MREVRARVGERRAAQFEEPLDVPLLDVLDPRVHVEREVEQVRDHEPRAGLQDVEAFDDEDVRPLHLYVLTRHDVVLGVRVDRRADHGRPGLDLGDETQQRAAVVRLRVPLAVHEPTALELTIGVEEPVRRNEVDPGVGVPAGEQRAQHTGGGGLAHRDRAGDPDHERHRCVDGLAEEQVGGLEQPLTCGDLQVDEAAEREVDLRDLVQVEVLAEAAKPFEILLGEDHGHRTPQPPPAPAVELHVRRVVAGMSAHGFRLWQVATGERVSGCVALD